MPSCSPIRLHAPERLAGSFRASNANRIARSRNSCGYFRGATIRCSPSRLDALHQTRYETKRHQTVCQEGKSLGRSRHGDPLFGQGWRPDGTAPLGRAFKVFEQPAPFRHAVTEAYQTYNTDRGLPAGAPVPVEARARIRTDVAQRLFAEQHARAPLDGRELSGFIAQASRPAQAAVGGFDLTFSPVKSVSVLWALAPLEVARQVESAHRAAVEDTIAWLEREVAFTRSGIGGVRQAPVRGLVATAFTHRDSRAGDPDLHTHVAVSNKVQTLPEDGARWLALDGRVLYKAKVAASERYNTRLEAELVARLGVRFTERRPPDGKRAIREIDGISPYLAKHWSSLRREIDRRRAELARNFQARSWPPADHGGGLGACPAGNAGDSRRQARATRRGRPARRLARRGR